MPKRNDRLPARVVSHLAARGPGTADDIAAAIGADRNRVALALYRWDGRRVVRCRKDDRSRAGRRRTVWRALAPGEAHPRGAWAPYHPRLAPLVAQAETLGKLAAAAREFLADVEQQHAAALAAVRRWGEENTTR